MKNPRKYIYPVVVLAVASFLYFNNLNQESYKTEYKGKPITLEHKRGQIKSGTDVFGNYWEKTMLHDYGYFDGIMGADGKELDVYINPDARTDKIFRVAQLNVKTGEFDEYKIMLNFESIGDARTGYLKNYPKDWKGFGGIEEITLEDIK
jgi:hypothetical protein